MNTAPKQLTNTEMENIVSTLKISLCQAPGCQFLAKYARYCPEHLSKNARKERVPYEIARKLVTRDDELRAAEIPDLIIIEGQDGEPDHIYPYYVAGWMVTTPEMLGWTATEWRMAEADYIKNGENHV